MTAAPRPPRIHLYTIPGLCPLCDEARHLLREMGLSFVETDIRTSRELLRLYRDEIPVVLVDGRKRFVGRVDPGGLRGFLNDS